MKVSDDLKDAILHEIWKRYPYSMVTVEGVYQKTKSFDKTIVALNNAYELAISPIDILNKIEEFNFSTKQSKQ